MWATKRRTKKAKIKHHQRLFRSMIVGGILLVFVGVIGYISYIFLRPQPLLQPIPKQQPGVVMGASEDPALFQIKTALEQKGVIVEQIKKSSDGNYQIRLKDNGEVILSQNHNLLNQIASLQVILVRLTMEGKRFAKLDMRFDKPVLSYE